MFICEICVQNLVLEVPDSGTASSVKNFEVQGIQREQNKSPFAEIKRLEI